MLHTSLVEAHFVPSAQTIRTTPEPGMACAFPRVTTYQLRTTIRAYYHTAYGQSVQTAIQNNEFTRLLDSGTVVVARLNYTALEL